MVPSLDTLVARLKEFEFEQGRAERLSEGVALVLELKSTFEVVVSSEATRIEDSPGRELAARYRKLRPSGRNCGKQCMTSARAESSEVTAWGVPPLAGT